MGMKIAGTQGDKAMQRIQRYHTMRTIETCLVECAMPFARVYVKAKRTEAQLRDERVNLIVLAGVR